MSRLGMHGPVGPLPGEALLVRGEQLTAQIHGNVLLLPLIFVSSMLDACVEYVQGADASAS
jgi:hypothetical protein